MPLPINLHLRGRRVLVAGGGSVAYRKAIALLEAGARLRVVSPQLLPELRRLLALTDAEVRERAYDSSDLADVALAIAATGLDAVNARIVGDASARGVLVCDASDADRGDFTMQAVVRVGDVTFTIDTGGGTPAFAKRIARELRERFGEGYGAAARTLARMRAYVKIVLPAKERGDVLRELAELPIERLATLDPAQAENEVEAVIERLHPAPPPAPTRTVVCASRASALAMTQTRQVAARLARYGTATTIVNVKTTGDRVQDRSLASIGTESLFVKELELALREGRADYAVHSCKDLPSRLPDDMCLAAVSAREDPRDAFCSERFQHFMELPAGARVGTSSPRRRAQLAALRDDLAYADVRGNVDTRLRKLREGEYDAIVLAMAGLSRLNLRARHTVPFAIDQIVPAVAQGALAVETRAESAELVRRLREAVNDPAAEIAVACERAALRELRGGCQAPIGIYAIVEGATLSVRAAVASPDGSRVVGSRRTDAAGGLAEAEATGMALARDLLENGAGEIIDTNPSPASLPLAGRLVLLPRTQERPSRIAAALRADGVEVVELRSGEASPALLGERIPDMILFPSSGCVAAASDYLQCVHLRGRRPAVATMGPASSAAAHAAGFTPDVVAPEAAAEALLRCVREYLQTIAEDGR